MTELDLFRPRIRNWSRVFRDRFIRHESNIMPYIRSIMALDGVETVEYREPIDVDDAVFIDECVTKLKGSSPKFSREFETIKAEYLLRYSCETYENTYDAEKAKKYKARYAKVFPYMYDETLLSAETQLMNFVQNQERARAEFDEHQNCNI